MKPPRSLRGRLGLSLGGVLTLLWVATASLTAVTLRQEMDEVFDSALQETAQRLLPLAVVDIIGREDDGITQRLGAIRDHAELFTYVVRDKQGRILLQSHAADPAIFPAYDGPGFRQTATHRIYNEDALRGSVRMTMAEPLEHRTQVAREIQMGLGLPLLIVIPIALLAIVVAVQASLGPVRRFQGRLAARNAQDLTPIPADDIPSEIVPIATTLNGLLDRLKGAFDAERSFAANAAHELRTPLAGAIAQAQRLQSETQDPAAKARAVEIEATLKRLTRLSERLMQLARAEGGRLRLDKAMDLRNVARIVIEDIARTVPADRIALTLSDDPVMSDLDPDAFGILCRNLVDNALRYGSDTDGVKVLLTADGTLTVSNEGAVVAADKLALLTDRFERAGAVADGSGLGLAIVAAIANRIGHPLVLKSPRPGSTSGFEATVSIPVENSTPSKRFGSVSDLDP
ncbi:Sensor protein QseC [Thalassovita gelatinovora]|uniref:histidine kinase n=1 Tax=Thalassovita gelatinovora TaxID=53501 RepID=A0A0P1FHF4_THAGE|nr:ATP-binding protein [Thalassovita gelatinovora]QIZ81995.1 two-component sensor histidine kinase [Thalassovita gelatinovora]CUH67444.1 Sensor protein QseC [Thalassovita gelatinovora]SEP73860.1 two-component system, OmpR family, sensor kinase [Thalassovita gelatinovora]